MSIDTYKRMVLDSGQLRIGYVDEANPGALLGATRGGAVFEVAGELRDMPADGAKGAVKGSERITRAIAGIEVTVIEFVSWVLQQALPGAIKLNWPIVMPTHDELKRYLTFALSDYRDTIALIAEVRGTDEPVVVVLRNVIGKKGLTAATVSGTETGIKIQFAAHYNPDDISAEPWEIYSAQLLEAGFQWSFVG